MRLACFAREFHAGPSRLANSEIEKNLTLLLSIETNEGFKISLKGKKSRIKMLLIECIFRLGKNGQNIIPLISSIEIWALHEPFLAREVHLVVINSS